MTCDPTCMINVNDKVNFTVVMGNGSESKGCKTGDIKGLLVPKDRKKTRQETIQNVAYSTSATNIFSLTYMMKKGWAMEGDNDGITLTKDGI